MRVAAARGVSSIGGKNRCCAPWRRWPNVHYVESRQSSRTRANFFHRLVGANKNNGAAVFSCVYDRFGNRWQQNGPNSMQLTFTGNNPGNPQNNNRIDGYSYDAAGNLLNDGVHSYAYNAENRITSVDAGSTATYLYDARNHAVTKTIFATDSQGEFAGSWDFLYDQSDRLITETAGNGSGALWRSEVFAGSRHLETSWDGNQYIDHPDHLGTDRALKHAGVRYRSSSNQFDLELYSAAASTTTAATLQQQPANKLPKIGR